MLTKAGVMAMFKGGLNGSPTKCTIKGRCRTHVFELPGVLLQADVDVKPLLITEGQRFKATVVSDLQSYFQTHSPFRHYSICCSLRSKVEESVQKETGKSRKDDSFFLFVVIEQETLCETAMDDGTCFMVDEEYIVGGYPGKTAIVAGKTSDGAWPEEKDDGKRFVNTVLAAMKVEQGTKQHIRKLLSESCFFDANERAVYSVEPTINAGVLVQSPPINEDELRVKIGCFQRLIDGFEADREKDETATSQLIDALFLEKSNDDYYHRTWYLRLFEATRKKLNGHWKQSFNQRHRDYRKKIAHPDAPDIMDMKRFNDLQEDVFAELRRIYLKTGTSS